MQRLNACTRQSLEERGDSDLLLHVDWYIQDGQALQDADDDEVSGLHLDSTESFPQALVSLIQHQM